jgi:GTP pyrophosphokinase
MQKSMSVSKMKLHTFQEVKEKFFVYISNPDARKKVEEAYKFASEAHKGQTRKSGEPYIHHLIEVCYILADIGCGPSTLIAGLLHDTVEDTSVTLEDIKEKFGEDVMNIVDSLTKIQRLKLSHKTESDFVYEDHRKIFLGMARDVRAILIKLADRLHNMRTLDFLSKDRQVALARETLEVFAPIAHRLGMNQIKSELEDLSLKYLEPEKYKEIVSLVESKVKNGQKSLDQMSKKIADDLFEKGIKFEMERRVKSIYSIYRKIYLKGRRFEEIFDILALRIITETELNCYEILGIIHATYKPIPGRFKDYIAMPKPNMYQSLHTCILSGDGNEFEVQIRTKEMDEIAESGVAAHWRYKEGSNYNPKKEQKEIEEQLHWFRDLVNMSEENEDAKEYVNTLSNDIFNANVYVFTPLGKVIELPTGATPIDFAYKIHTGVAEKAVGAIVNHIMVPLSKELKTGDIVEIKTSEKSQGPNEGWLNIATTGFAKSHIRKFLAKKNAEFTKEEKISRGRTSVIEAFKQLGINELETMRLIDSEALFEKFNVKDLDELLVGISNKNPIPGALIEFLNLKKQDDGLKLSKIKESDTNKTPVYLNGNVGDIAITLGNCCTPIPGDEIVGYITKGKGITVHRKDCPNIVNEKKRLIEVFWKDNLKATTYPVDLKIECYERPNLLADIVSVFSQKKINITAVNGVFHPNTMTTTISVTIYVANADVLRDVIAFLLNVKSVYEVNRSTH